MPKPLPDWLPRLENMLPGEVIIVPATKTGTVRRHLQVDEIATGRRYWAKLHKVKVLKEPGSSETEKVVEGVSITRKS